MPSKKLFRGLLVCFAVLSVTRAGAAEPGAVGSVERVEHEAAIVSARGVVAAVPGAAVHVEDELRTGPNGRLQVIFIDQSILTLGEQASIKVNRYLYAPDQNAGETVLAAVKGAFRFASGRIKELEQSNIQVATPFAVIGVRGTEFWGGPIEKAHGVLLLEGEVTVTNRGGSVTLAARGQGTDIASADQAPGAVKAWSDAKIAGAVASVALH